MHDVGIIGGGVAGLQAALTLGRACRSVVVLDDGRQRNRPAPAVRGFLGVPEASPADLLATAWTSLAEHAVDHVDARVEGVTGSAEDGFAVHAAGTSYEVRAVVLASGLVDALPDVPGVADLWGRGVVACPHCHGWEVRGRPLAQLTHPDRPARRGVERAVLLSRWSDDVTFFSSGTELTDHDRDRLQAARVRLDPAPVLEVSPLADGSVAVSTGTSTAAGAQAFAAVFTTVEQHQKTSLAAALGCATTTEGRDAGGIRVDQQGRTDVPGVYAAGSAVVPSLLAIGAAGHASAVATTVHGDLVEDELRRSR